MHVNIALPKIKITPLVLIDDKYWCIYRACFDLNIILKEHVTQKEVMNDDSSVQYRRCTTHRETYDCSYGIHSYSLRITFHMLFSLKYLSRRTQFIFIHSEILLLPKMNTCKQSRLLKCSTWAQVLRQQSAGICKGSFSIIQMAFSAVKEQIHWTEL